MTMQRTDYCYNMPRRWYHKPLEKVNIDWYKSNHWLDENGNITPEGKANGIVLEEILGTETREHYEEYLKHWKPYYKKWRKWADEELPWDQEPKFDYVEKWDSEQ